MRQKTIFFVTIVVTLLIGSFGGIFIYEKYFDKEQSKNVETTETVVQKVDIKENDTIQPGVEKIYDAVVYIASYKNGNLYSTGTGFIYKKTEEFGYIITNHHVINNATSIKITDSNGKSVDATLLGSDEYADIAVLTIDSKNVLNVSEIGESTKLKLGDTLFTVGSPLGIDYMGTVTKGILSGKERAVSVDLESGGSFVMEVLQTDATINPGNSGGPLCNINGEVIGVNSLKIVDDKVEGMGFAIPIEIAMGLVERLEKGEKIQRPYLGVEVIEILDTVNLAKRGIVISEEIENGVALGEVVENTPAKEAGLQKGDVITEVEGVKVKGVAHFRFLLYKYEVGDKIKVKYYRNNKYNELSINLTMSIEDAN